MVFQEKSIIVIFFLGTRNCWFYAFVSSITKLYEHSVIFLSFKLSVPDTALASTMTTQLHALFSSSVTFSFFFLLIAYNQVRPGMHAHHPKSHCQGPSWLR